jgi:hypothetical protein
MKRRIFAGIVVVALALFAIACGKKGEEGGGGAATSGNPLHAAWKVVEATGAAAETNIDTIYTFRPDGKLTIAKGFSQDYTYTTEGDTLHWQLNENFKFQGKFSITGNKLNLSIESAGQALVLERQ